MDCSLGAFYYYFIILPEYLSLLTDLLTYLLTVGSSRHRHSHKQTALVTASFTKLGFLNSHTNSVFFTFPFPAVPVTDTFLMFRGCPLMRTSTLPTYVILTY